MDHFTPSTVLGTGLFGLLLGILYRWRISEDGNVRVWVIGFGFLVIEATVTRSGLGEVLTHSVLWAWMCVWLSVGRRLRLRLEARRLAGRVSSMTARHSPPPDS